MMSSGLLVDGLPVQLGDRIGRGGEGEVFLLVDGKRALKVYTDGKSADREAKIAAMVRRQLGTTTTLVAFPLALVRDRHGKFVGFTMNLVSGHKPLHELYAPGARKQNFSHATYPFLVRAAQNVARAVATVHASGCVVGDLNHSGILISKKATAALIDADSFQVVDGSQKFLCRVGVPEYTPPELQGKNLAGIERSADHDAFGLAVIVFLLLSMGRHPFVGTFERGEIALPRAIAEYRFAYSKQRKVGMTLPPGVCTIDDFPIAIANAFERAFSAESRGNRPRATEWITLLENLEKSLRPCAANALHHFSDVQVGCPWCRMEQRLGITLFQPSFDVDPKTIPTFNADDIGALVAQIEAIRVPPRASIKPVISLPVLAPSAEVLASKKNDTLRHGAPYALYAVAMLVLIAAPAAWLLAIGVAALGYFTRPSTNNVSNTLIQTHKAIAHRWEQALDAWATLSKIGEIERLKVELQNAKSDYMNLRNHELQALEQYVAKRQSIQLTRYLEGFRIANAKIKGIGTAKVVALRSYGIETAAEVIKTDVLAVPGFGPVNSMPLFDWRARLERQFVYRGQHTAADQHEIARIRAETKQRAIALKDKLTTGARELYRLASGCNQFLATPDQQLQRIAKELKQIEVDAAHIGVSLPSPRMMPDLTRIPTPGISGLRQSIAQPALPPLRTTRTPSHARPAPNVASMMGQPNCPNCGKSMVRRTARRGHNAGGQFWGCSAYPGCRGTRPI